MIAIVPLIAVLAGLLLFALAEGKPSTVGLYVFATAFLALMLSLATRTIRIL